MGSKEELLRLLADAAARGDADVKVVGMGDVEGKSAAKLDKPTQARVLKDMLPEVQRACPFQVGDIVEQSQFGSYRWPRQGQLAIVSGHVAPQLGARNEDGPFTREDMIVLCDIEGRWIEFSVESWRFKRYDGPVE